MSDPAHNYYLTTNPQAINLTWLMDELRATYFGAKRTDEQMVECIRNSLCFSIFRRDYLAEGFPSHRDSQVAFARVVHDGVLFGWISDFLVDRNQRKKGIGHDLMHRILEHHTVKGLTLNLCSRDAGEFYAKFGFAMTYHMMRRPTP